MDKSAVAARKLFVLTRDGVVEGATYNPHKADQWMALGDMYDFIPVVPEAYTDETEPPVSVKQQPTKAVERTQDITKEQDKLRKQVERQLKRFQPVSSLLKP